MPKCIECKDTGVIKIGSNDIPCNCKKGDETLFDIVGVRDLIPGKEVRQHFLNKKETLKPVFLGKKLISVSSLSWKKAGNYDK